MFSPSTTLIVVDVQNDFADPAGSLFVNGAPRVIPFINQQIDAATKEGALIVASQDWHPLSTPHFQKDGGIWPDHCVAGTWGAEFHPDLNTPNKVIQKGVSGEDGYSAFTVRDPATGAESSTGLDGILSEAGVVDVIIVGFATDYCVKDTAIDASRCGFTVVVLADGISAVNIEPGDGARACGTMVDAGVKLR